MSEKLPAEACPNCDTPLTGSYCSECGQRGRFKRLGLSTIFEELRQDLLCGDVAFLRTVKALFINPGQACLGYIGGHRKSFVNPLRFCFWTLAILLSLTMMLKLDIDLGLSDQVMTSTNMLDVEGDEVASEIMSRTVAFRGLMFKYINILFFFSYPLFAFLIRLLYRKKGRNFTEIFAAVLLVNGQLNLLKMVLIFVALLSPAWSMGLEAALTFAYTTWFLIGFFRMRVWTGILMSLATVPLFFVSISLVIIPVNVLYLIWPRLVGG
jgi:hypothetical protein